MDNVSEGMTFLGRNLIISMICKIIIICIVIFISRGICIKNEKRN